MISWFLIAGIIVLILGIAYLGSKTNETEGKSGDSTGAKNTTGWNG